MAASKTKYSKSLIRCFLCKHAKLMQWVENPIIADCMMRHERFVALADRQCQFFDPHDNPDPEIVHYDHYDDNDNF